VEAWGRLWPETEAPAGVEAMKPRIMPGEKDRWRGGHW
jgi:hypothetical protein